MTHPITGGSFVHLPKSPLLAPRPEPRLAHSLQVVRSQGQLGRRRRHGREETRQQCIENSGEHLEGGQLRYIMGYSIFPPLGLHRSKAALMWWRAVHFLHSAVWGQSQRIRL